MTSVTLLIHLGEMRKYAHTCTCGGVIQTETQWGYLKLKKATAALRKIRREDPDRKSMSSEAKRRSMPLIFAYTSEISQSYTQRNRKALIIELKALGLSL